MIRRLSYRLALKTISSGDNTADIEALAYGYEMILSKSVTYVTILCISLLLSQIMETIAFMVFFMVLRGYTGGYHLDSGPLCILFSVLLCTISASFARFLSMISLPLFVFPLVLISVLYIIRCSPINHPNLNLQKGEVEMCRKNTRRVLFIELSTISILFVLQALPAIMLSGALAIIFTASLMVIAKIHKQEVPQNG